MNYGYVIFRVRLPVWQTVMLLPLMFLPDFTDEEQKEPRFVDRGSFLWAEEPAPGDQNLVL